jgi:hypothetical protein
MNEFMDFSIIWLNSINFLIFETKSLNSKLEEVEKQIYFKKSDGKLSLYYRRTIILKVLKLKAVESESLKSNDFIINNINTGWLDSTEFVKNELKRVMNLILPLARKNFENFCKILEYVINLMHQDYNDYNFLQNSADEWWEKNKDRQYISMEANWLQPKISYLLNKQFGENVVKEADEVRGSTDFLVFKVPIECKVLTDKNPYPKGKSAIEIIEELSLQSFQQTGHTRCGILIAYDFRKVNIIPEHRVKSIVERIKFKILGSKLIGMFVFSGIITKPSVIK